mmetsp:Transcript_13782/g.40711  ORF Transcript_13782/g.40711 Transcript_13782/m.40711 type:complete len:352 (+) Transcript_13782:415-1470(+)
MSRRRRRPRAAPCRVGGGARAGRGRGRGHPTARRAEPQAGLPLLPARQPGPRRAQPGRAGRSAPLPPRRHRPLRRHLARPRGAANCPLQQRGRRARARLHVRDAVRGERVAPAVGGRATARRLALPEAEGRRRRRRLRRRRRRRRAKLRPARPATLRAAHRRVDLGVLPREHVPSGLRQPAGAVRAALPARGVPLPARRPHLQGVGHPQPRADPARLLRLRVRRRVHLRRRGGEPRHPVRQPKDESADGRVRKRQGCGPHVHRRDQVLERRPLPQPLVRAERLQAARVLRPPRAAAQDSLLRPRGHPASRGALLRLRVCGRAGQDHAMSLRRKELQKAAVLSAKRFSLLLF